MTIRREYLLRGVVQGVGFRPHVAVVAARHAISGFVGNDDLQVFVEAQGEIAEVEAFLADVLATLPPLARVISTAHRDLTPVADEAGFRIVASRHVPGARTLVPPDVATCDDCLADSADPDNRRFGYAFTTCTNCGPRLSIIEDLPYDRPATTMRGFPLCDACRAEYTDPSDRRFHAQPISCFDCGPRLWVATPGSQPAPGDDRRAQHRATLGDAAARLARGEVLAVKGLGGFHLVCDARNPDAVERLRARKRRVGKPFAVMVADLAAAHRLADLSEAQAELLASPARPIVIAPMAPTYDLADAVAPGLADVGVLLAYTPLHTLLLASGMALVATSGNLSEEPLCFTNADALDRLAGLADAFVLHDRDIHVPVEDSVFLAGRTSGAAETTVPARRSRGYAPLPVVLPDAGSVVLAVGGELKNTFALATGDLAFVSAHLGDMGSLASQRAFEASVAQLVDIHRVTPEVVVHDLHPSYATTAWAQRYADAHPDVRLVGVQHHHAHALSLLAEHGFTGTAVVATLDGTGYGTDATIWGGEVLVVSPTGWRRGWHVPTFGLVGGDRAIRHPWRVARGLAHAWGLDIDATPAVRLAPADELRLVDSQLASGFGVVGTSSAGRLFDAAAALVGVSQHATYEAQPAMELERVATAWSRAHPRAVDPGDAASLPEVVRRLLDNRLAVGERAWRFHVDLAAVVAQAVATEAERVGTRTVGVTGGVAMNRLISGWLVRGLADRGFTVLTHRTVPPNDGGLSLGQAWAGRLA